MFLCSFTVVSTLDAFSRSRFKTLTTVRSGLLISTSGLMFDSTRTTSTTHRWPSPTTSLFSSSTPLNSTSTSSPSNSLHQAMVTSLAPNVSLLDGAGQTAPVCLQTGVKVLCGPITEGRYSLHEPYAAWYSFSILRDTNDFLQ